MRSGPGCATTTPRPCRCWSCSGPRRSCSRSTPTSRRAPSRTRSASASASDAGGPAPRAAPLHRDHPPRRARLGRGAGRGAGRGRRAGRALPLRPARQRPRPGGAGPVRDPRVVGRGQGPVRDQPVRGHPRLPARGDPAGHLAGRARPLHGRPPGARLGARGDAGRGAAGAGLRARPRPRAGGRGRGWYRGDLHTHTVHSDGRRTPAQLAAAARAAGLDFFASTEHNTTSANLDWGRHAGPGLLVVDGQEVTTRDGHWLALGLGPGPVVDWRHRAGDGGLGRAVAGLRDRGGLAVAAHPFCPLPGCGWGFGYQDVDAVEVWNGPWGADDEAALVAWDRLLAGPGRFLPAVAGSDAHGPGDRVGLPHTVVLAGGLDRRSVLDGLAAGRCWLAGSAAVDLRLEATAAGASAGIGERLAVPAGQEVAVRLQGRGAPGCLARLCGPGGPALEAGLGAGAPETVEWRATAAPGAWARAEVRGPPVAGASPGPMLALTNPVWFGPAET